jgi:hypothetical protein
MHAVTYLVVVPVAGSSGKILEKLPASSIRQARVCKAWLHFLKEMAASPKKWPCNSLCSYFRQVALLQTLSHCTVTVIGALVLLLSSHSGTCFFASAVAVMV